MYCFDVRLVLSGTLQTLILVMVACSTILLITVQVMFQGEIKVLVHNGFHNIFFG